MFQVGATGIKEEEEEEVYHYYTDLYLTCHLAGSLTDISD
jgi:hypothetical protein